MSYRRPAALDVGGFWQDGLPCCAKKYIEIKKGQRHRCNPCVWPREPCMVIALTSLLPGNTYRGPTEISDKIYTIQISNKYGARFITDMKVVLTFN